MTERLHFDFSLSCIGEGNGKPLQCSCLENPRDRGAWWASVYGNAQSRTWLKQLSSSSSNRLPNTGKHQLFSFADFWCVAVFFSSVFIPVPKKAMPKMLKVKVKVKSFSHVWVFATPWIVAYQAPPSMGFFRQEYWSRVPLPSPLNVTGHC